MNRSLSGAVGVCEVVVVVVVVVCSMAACSFNANRGGSLCSVTKNTNNTCLHIELPIIQVHAFRGLQHLVLRRVVLRMVPITEGNASSTTVDSGVVFLHKDFVPTRTSSTLPVFQSP